MIRPPVRALKSCTKRCTLSSVRLPGTTLTTKRCSGSKATWSQFSPWRASSAVSGSQCFSFLPTKAHFSSNWTSLVWGGKSHEFIVDLLGVMAGDDGQANDRILVHPHEAAGLADATVLLKMLQHRDGFVLGEFAAIKGRALAFGEALLTGAAGQNPGAFAGAIAETDPEIVQAPAAIVIAVEGLAAEGFQVVHSLAGLPWGNEKVVSQLESPYKAAGNMASLVGHYPVFRFLKK